MEQSNSRRIIIDLGRSETPVNGLQEESPEKSGYSRTYLSQAGCVLELSKLLLYRRDLGLEVGSCRLFTPGQLLYAIVHILLAQMRVDIGSGLDPSVTQRLPGQFQVPCSAQEPGSKGVAQRVGANTALNACFRR